MDRLTRLRIQTGGNPAVRLSLIAPYDLELRLPGGAVLQIGRFSVGLLQRLRVAPSVKDAGQVICRVGAFCEAAEGVTIFVGGRHNNAGLLNITFGPVKGPFFSEMDSDNQAATELEASGSLTLGDNVTLSFGATVVSGASVGEGSVIGARALVTGRCEPLGVYGGVPAKRLRDRLAPHLAELYPALRLGDIHAHHLPRLPSLLRRLERGEIGLSDYLGQVTFLPARPRLIMNAVRKGDYSIGLAGLVGFAMGDEPVSDPAAIAALGAYFSQMGNGAVEELDWSPDIFTALGL